MVRFLHRSLKPILRRLPLRVVLSAPFVLQMVIVTAAISYLSQVNGQRSVDNLATQLMYEIGDRVEQHLQGYTESAQQVVQLLVDDIAVGLPRSDDWRSQLPYWLKRSQIFSRVHSISIGNQQGQFIDVEPISTEPAAYLVKVTETADGLYHTYRVSTGASGSQQLKINPIGSAHFDPRQQSWYKTAIATQQPIWSAIHTSLDSASSRSTLTAAQPFYESGDERQQIAGVAAANLYLDDLNRFLINLRLSRSGDVFILEPNGLLVASSRHQSAYHSVNGELQRIAASSSQDQLMRTVLAQITRQFGGLDQIYAPQTLTFQQQGQQFAQVRPWQNGRGLNWVIIVIVPESDFMAQIHANNRLTMLLCGLATLIAIGVSVITTHWMTAPLIRLNLAAKNIARGKWQPPILIDRADEVGELANSFNQMAVQLQQSFDALHEGQSQLAKFLEAVPIGICVVEPNGKVSYMNQTAQTLLGRSFESEISSRALVSLCNAQLTHPNDINSPYPLERLPALRTLQAKKVTVETIEIDRNQQTIPLEVRATPVLDTAGQVSQTIVAFQDVSDRKQAATLLADYNRTLEAQIAERTTELTQTNFQLKQAKQAAEAASLAKSTFLANMSHELRTPLNAILGFAQIMSLDSNASPDQKQHLRIINRSGEHLLSLINNVLDLSKLESGQIKLNKTCFDLTELLETIDRTLRQRVEDKGLQLQLNALPAEGQIVSDVNKLRQILVNLLSNSVKFTEQGQVSLRVRLEPADADTFFSDQAEITAQFEQPMQPQWLIFEIEDTGIGIPDEELERIFNAFEQSSQGKMTPEGTGLGLTISHKFVKLMQGEIAVSSTYGAGSLFTVRLPVYRLHSLKSAPNQQQLPSTVQKRLLIVDDQTDNRDLLIRMLNPLRLEIKEVANGEAAITCWQAWRPDLILLDMYMPKMSGIQVVQQIRHLEQAAVEAGQSVTATQSPQTVIIALSASVIETDREMALTAGCNSFINKPFQAQDLLNLIAQHLQLPPGQSTVPVHSAQSTGAIQPAVDALSLDFMPQEWRDQLYQAAIRCRDEQVMQLLQQIPIEHQSLADRLHNYAEKFQFEMILQLLQGYSKNDECPQ